MARAGLNFQKMEEGMKKEKRPHPHYSFHHNKKFNLAVQFQINHHIEHTTQHTIILLPATADIQ